MVSPITWLWNIKHRKLIEETKQIIRLHWFLRYDCGLKYVDRLSARDLKRLLYVLKSSIIKPIININRH
jgi:lantibiotic modifying enzyme